MARIAEPCSCTPYSLLCCCGPQIGISVIQPSCQNLPDGSVVNNPAYVPLENKSYWTFKFITDCNSTTRAISNFGIPICESISKDVITVSEKIDGCGTFQPVPFTLIKDDPNLGPAPPGFQYLKVETGGRYEKGVSVEYRIEIIGDYPTSLQPIKVKAGNNVLTFDCGCFLVPQCPPQGKLAMTKKCSETIVNNQATLSYNLTVANIGNSPLQNVQYLDLITIPLALTPGVITVTPATLTVDTSTSGLIRISGNLGTINPGAVVNITYTIPIIAISEPGRYLITNTALATATGTQATATCSANIKAVKLDTQKCCVVTDTNKGAFRLSVSSIGLSPDTSVDISDEIFIPAGVNIQFNSFDGCTATFADTGTPVPLNINIAGPRRIIVSCSNIPIPTGNTVQKNITFTLISSSAPGTTNIENSLISVAPTRPEEQVFLGAGTLPARADIQVQLSMNCLKPC
ncbi:MAG: hypothetical protein ACPLTR_05200 [Thermacetogeniaceae bacterium]